MAPSAVDLKQQAHRLIDSLEPGHLSAVVGILKIIVDPVARSIANAPYNNEAISEEEREIRAIRASLSRGGGIPREEILAEFGLTLEDWERMNRT